MKRFWNYIFYFTWKFHNVIGYYFVEKPLDYLFGLSNFWDKHNKRGKKDARNIIENPYSGFNIGFAFYCMLVSTEIICVCIISVFVVFFDLDIKNRVSAITVLIIIFLPAYLFNEFLLGWHKKTYLTYFKELERISNKRLGYLITLCFHLGVILLGILIFIWM
ncbi:hypothetical protein F9B74_06705 [Pelistega sp. NLN82]|uniref:Uncharacterized protein n=1 Tax=Pelistega ratti TaxID=2652177 RepID=A0A6L9Y6N9_9BURK|nr:hypothetical protein [Pelistega ratti]NEN76013.1 hypothetical protein [Pelistega ratti]